MFNKLSISYNVTRRENGTNTYESQFFISLILEPLPPPPRFDDAKAESVPQQKVKKEEKGSKEARQESRQEPSSRQETSRQEAAKAKEIKPEPKDDKKIQQSQSLPPLGTVPSETVSKPQKTVEEVPERMFIKPLLAR